ncbi:MAG TPA: maleylpyruvate isomerase family mycothiol-dependent enzyme [Acidimicrobiales bacterium]|nr:maleylpyruvate isomerase family mycothiol-dependent enzyme [Acidimicrobiales bacterium]
MDYDGLRLQEMGAISELLHELRPEEWDVPSVCDGWRVRDVIGHMCLGYTTPMPTMVAKIGRYGFNVPKASREESITYASARSPEELLGVFDAIHRDNIRKGISKVIKPAEGLVDHTIHHQDIRRPLHRPRTVPPDRLVAALGVIPGLGGFVGAKKRVQGLRLVATDVEWSAGAGPEVRGPGEAILLAASGRQVSLPELDGDGVATLRARMAA